MFTTTPVTPATKLRINAPFRARFGVRMTKTGEKKEDMVRDLIEQRKRGNMTSEEIIQELSRRGLRYWIVGPHTLVVLLSMLGWGILCFLSLLAKLSLEVRVFPPLPMLESLTRLPTIIFPAIIRYLAIIFGLCGLAVGVYAARLRAKKGGTRSENETIMLLREGPYQIVRHTSDSVLYWFMLLFTVFLSEYVPFTILSVIGNLFLFLGGYYACVAEEKLDVLKWGEEYRRYQKDVPRLNFIRGIWRWARRKRPSSLAIRN